MRLPKLNWDDPVREAYENRKNRVALNRRTAFDAAYRRYALKLLDVSFIWDRLRLATDAHESYLDLVKASVDKLRVGEVRTLTSDEEMTRKRLEEPSKTLSLDYEDFLIHSRILMDRVVFLTQFFLATTEKMPSFHSFTKHREFFVENNSFPDVEYARYIRDNTQWYETLLRPYRDDFVVHDISSKPYGLYIGPGEPPRFLRVPGHEEEKRRQLAWTSITAIREKYLNKIPGLADVTVNVYELTDFLESHASMIEPADLAILIEVRKSFGAKLPDVIELADNIKGYLDFVGMHFGARK